MTDHSVSRRETLALSAGLGAVCIVGVLGEGRQADSLQPVQTMSNSDQPIEWYLARDGRRFGPLSGAEMEKFAELGYLRTTDLLWRHGFADWRPASHGFL